VKYILISSAAIAFGLCQAHDPIDITAKLLDDYLEIVIHHTCDDPDIHYINHVHVTTNRGTTTLFEQDFEAQTDTQSLDIQLAHPPLRRKRMKKHALICVEATCNQDGTLKKKVRVE